MSKTTKIISTTVLGVALISYSAFSQSGTSGGGSGSSGGTTGSGSSSSTGGGQTPKASPMDNSNTGTTGTMPGTTKNSTDWNTENKYWRQNYPTRPYYNKSKNYSVYEPSYRYGMELYNMNPDTGYESLDQKKLREDWMKANKNSKLTWEQVEPAVRDSYMRLYDRKNTITTDPGTPQ